MTYQPHQSEDATLKPIAGECSPGGCFDLERMKKAIASGFIQVPPGLRGEELREFLRTATFAPSGSKGD